MRNISNDSKWSWQLAGRSPKSEARSRKQNSNFNKTMEFKFEKLIIWQKAMEYGESIF